MTSLESIGVEVERLVHTDFSIHLERCRGRDSNPHVLNGHRILNPARLPFRHLGLRFYYTSL
ncbi:MAG: hypothetical protein UX95_C0011G0018, partial [Candidatus Woesebacteria bacterium GW2011_GWD1_47_21]